MSGAFDGVVPSADIASSDTATTVATTVHSAFINVTPPGSPLPPAFSPTATTSTRQPTRSATYATLKGIDSNGMPDAPEWTEDMGEGNMVLELADGLALAGHSFGAEKSVAGECVFQTGK
jgi:carbamoyl-phosphate synthase/aspartate carbamoyltransferase